MTTTVDAPLSLGTQAPAFDLPASHSKANVCLADFAGKNLILVFYPKDQTPGCTRQLCALQTDRNMFRELNTEVLASNPASRESHERFSEKQGYEFPILVDANREMAKAYQALKENGTSIQRTVYIIDSNGMIRYAKQGLPSDEELAEAIRHF